MNTYPNAADIEKAAELLSTYIAPTEIRQEELLPGTTLFFKMENSIPEVFAFKARGALYAALQIPEAERAKGIVAHSSGNHGGAIAWAAKLLGIPAYIAVPHNITQAKRDNILRHGAYITECEPFKREETAQALVAETGGTFIHPFNNFDVITGQATAAREFHRQVPGLDHIIVPVGGGGLLSGTILATQYFSPKTEILAGEPFNADDAYRSLGSGRIQDNETVDTVADGLRSQHLGTLTFPIIQKGVSRIIRVTEEEILIAQKLLQESLACAIEPSSAVAYAAIAKEDFQGNRVGIIITGGNVEES